MEQSQQQQIWKQIKQLIQQTQENGEEHHETLKALADKLLVGSVEIDVCAFDVWLVSCLHLSDWRSAIGRCAERPLMLQHDRIRNMYAYALYRDKQHQQALQQIEQIKSKDIGALQLEAQANYRSGAYSASVSVYERIEQLSSQSDEDDHELNTNMLAALLSAGQLNKAKLFIKKLNLAVSPDTFELAYNASCAFVEANDWSMATQMLHTAQAVCRESLSADGASAEEIQNELAVLHVQEAYILQILNQQDQALEIYNRVLNSKPSDSNVVSVASNNLISLRKSDERVWDSLKRSNKAAHAIEIDDKLSIKQKQTFALNRALMLLQGKQYAKCKELLNKLQEEYKDWYLVVLAQAALLNKEKKIKEADQLIESWLLSHSGESVDGGLDMRLARAHLAVQRNEWAAATQVLEDINSSNHFTNIKYQPALLSALIALYEKQSMIAQAHALMSQAIQYWKNQKGDLANKNAESCLEQSVDLYVRHGLSSAAASELERVALHEKNPVKQQESIARLILAYKNDSSKSQKFAKMLPAFPITHQLDIKVLENTPAPEMQKKRKAPVGKSRSATDTESDVEESGVTPSLAASAARARRTAARKTKRRKRYPKGFDPANTNNPPPDPERWLPKWERTTCKKSRKRQQTMRGAQGSTNMANAATPDVSSSGVESKAGARVSGAAAAAARKRANKRR